MSDIGIRLLALALSQYGEAETPGPKATRRIGEWLQGVGLAPNDETSWCSAFLYWCAGQLQLEGPPVGIAAAARSWLRVGQDVGADPRQGDVVILARDSGTGATWTGHVGLVARISDSGRIVWVLGGNQKNAVSIAPFPTARVLGYRRLQTLLA